MLRIPWLSLCLVHTHSQDFDWPVRRVRAGDKVIDRESKDRSRRLFVWCEGNGEVAGCGKLAWV